MTAPPLLLRPSFTGLKNNLTSNQRLTWCYRHAGLSTIAGTLFMLCSCAALLSIPISGMQALATALIIRGLVSMYMNLLTIPALIMFHHRQISGARPRIMCRRHGGVGSPPPSQCQQDHYHRYTGTDQVISMPLRNVMPPSRGLAQEVLYRHSRIRLLGNPGVTQGLLGM